jgi:hypothetical protein
MERTRYRDRGKGSLKKFVTESPLNLSTDYGASVQWMYNKWNGEPNLEPKEVQVFGRTVTVYPPAMMKDNSGYDHYIPVDVNQWKEDERSRIHALLDPELIMLFYYPAGLIAMVEEEDSGTMVDVVGSGFTKSKGKAAVVNPCESNNQIASCGIGTIGSDSLSTSAPFTAYSSSGNTRIITFRMQISITVARRVGLSDSANIALDSQLSSYLLDPLDACDSLFSSAHAGIQKAEWELLTTLAEANKTLAYVTGRMKDAAGIIKSARKGDFSFLKKKPDVSDARDLWLEARYAIRPIVYDVANAMQAFNKDKRLSPFIRSSRRDSLESTENIQFSYTSGDIDYVLEGTATIVHELRAGVYATLEHNLPNVKLLGLLNLASTAWELVPWSFVVNWFVNTSTIISSLNPNPVYAVNKGYCSVNTTIVFNGTLTASVGGETKVTSISKTLSQYKRVLRTNPSLISIDVNLTVPKLLDLMALAFK